jgi:GDP-4-dehydro-6-deoxy-D-mannose reductase
MSGRALVTGIGGFVGGHLAPALREAGFEVFGIDRARHATGEDTRGDTLVGDVGDPAVVAKAMREFQPSHIFHLAWSFDPAAKGNASPADRDVLAASALFDAVRRFSSQARILLASSSAVYGSPTVLPIDEDAPLKPTTAYGASKVLIEKTASAFSLEHRLDVVVTRTFNLIGPGVPARLLPGSLTAQIAAAEKGGPRSISVGRLDSSRDYVDVRDAVRAYLALAQWSGPGPRVFNVCAGLSRSCQDLADALIAAARVPVTLAHDANRMQAGDVDCQRGLAARLERATGWRPEIPFSTSVRDMLEAERTSKLR